jgi:hypothetical protein
MDAGGVRGALEQHFDNASTDPIRAHAMYAKDAVLEFPQSGERFEGVDNFREWRSDYPEDTSVEFREVRGSGEHWVAEIAISYGGGEPKLGVSILEFRDDLIARETIYVADPWEAPEWRARWRSAP